jgi:hypothetical protein
MGNGAAGSKHTHDLLHALRAPCYASLSRFKQPAIASVNQSVIMHVDLYRFNQAELATACTSVGAWDIDHASCMSRSIARLLAPIAVWEGGGGGVEMLLYIFQTTPNYLVSGYL